MKQVILYYILSVDMDINHISLIILKKIIEESKLSNLNHEEDSIHKILNTKRNLKLNLRMKTPIAYLEEIWHMNL